MATWVSRERAADLVALDDAMNALARFDRRKAQVVEMRFFGDREMTDGFQPTETSR